jgi:hypothetical protein
MVLSKHARVRMQQRGIPRRVVDWLAAYGAVDYQGGSELYYFDRRARQALARDVGPRQLARYAKALNAYMICADGQISTVGHRHQRVVRH